MNKRIVDDVYEIVDDILEIYDKKKQKIAVVGYYETILEIMNALIKVTEGICFESGVLENPEYTEYEDSFYLLLEDDGITTGEMWNDFNERYLILEPDCAFVEEDFADDYFDVNEDKNVVVFGFDDVHDYIEHDDKPCVCMTKDKKGFTFCVDDEFGHTKFKYHGNKVLSEEEMWDIIATEFS